MRGSGLACSVDAEWTILRAGLKEGAFVPGRPDRHRTGEPRAAQRPLARDLPPDRRELSRDRRPGRLAQPVTADPNPAVARIGAQRDGRPRAARLDLCAAHLGRTPTDRAGLAL